MIKGITAEIFRWDLGDCTNAGITSRKFGRTSVTVIGLGDGSEVFTPDTEAPAVIIDKSGGYFRAYPADLETGKKLDGWFMFGGNYIYTSDSRFSNQFSYPVPMHDRTET